MEHFLARSRQVGLEEDSMGSKRNRSEEKDEEGICMIYMKGYICLCIYIKDVYDVRVCLYICLYIYK